MPVSPRLALFGLALAVLPQVALATDYSETFPDPLGGWTNRWLYQNSNLSNYFYASGYSSDQDFRAPANAMINGLWFATTKGFNSMGTPGPVATIQFDTAFAVGLTHLNMDFAFFPTATDVTVRDAAGLILLQHTVTRAAGQGGTEYAVDVNSLTGIGSIEMSTVPYQGVQVLGNVYIIGAQATAAVPEPASCAALAFGLLAVHKRRALRRAR